MDESLEAYRGTLHLTQRRYQAGDVAELDVAELDVARVQTEVAATESEALALERQQAQLRHALAVLVGDVAMGFSLPPAAVEAALPVIPPGVPSTVLARRPDVSAAQAAVLAAQARVGVAQAAWFPALALTGSAGFASPELGGSVQVVGAFVGHWHAAVAAALRWRPARRPGGGCARPAGRGARRPPRPGAHSLSRGGRPAQRAAPAGRQAQAQAQDRAVQSAARAAQLSDSRYRNGLVSQLELLDARRSELRNRRQALQVRTAQYVATVGLVRALGGGWDTTS